MKMLTRERLKAKFFRGLSDPSRLLILEELRRGPRNVGELVEATGLLQPNASLHLNCLYCCGLVNRERRGRRIYYFIKSSRVERLLADGDRALDEVAERIEECSRYE